MRSMVGVLFGVFIALAGVSIVMDLLFHVHLPIVRSAFAMLLIVLGVRILLNAWSPRLPGEGRGIFFSRSHLAPTRSGDRLKYDVAFGEAVVDLTALPPGGPPTLVEVNTLFGSSTVEIDPKTALAIDASSVFGEARMPDNTSASFGQLSYRPKGPEKRAPQITVKINVVFGSCRVVEVGATQPLAPAAPPPAHPVAS